MAQTWLYAKDGGRPLAWSDDGIWYFNATGGGVYGWRSGDWLYITPGSQRIGFIRDGWLYASDSRPIGWLSK